MLGFMVSIWGCKEKGKKEKYMLSSCCVNSIHESNTRQKNEKRRGGRGLEEVVNNNKPMCLST